MRYVLQTDDSTLHGVQIVALGEAEGHDFSITEDFMAAVVKLAADGPVKVRLNHPEGSGDVASIVGEASNFYLDGDCVRADVRLFDLPEKSRIMTLAREAGHLFGMSLDFAGETIKKAGQKLKTMTCETIYGVDFVDNPAATRALFAAGSTNNQRRVFCRFNTSAVDSPKQVKELDMAKTDLKEKKLAEVPPVVDEETKHPEPDGDEGQDKVMAALASIEARLTKLEAGKPDDKAEEKLADEPPVEDEKDEEKMATMAAKVCSIMLAKVGVKPRASAPVADEKPAGDGEKLSVEDEKLCKALKMDETERKQFAANLVAAQKRIKL